MRNVKIRTLQTYSDWLDKAKYEYELYAKSYGVYELANCFLTLNALPEWIAKSTTAPQILIDLAEDKIRIMKGDNNRFILDENKLDQIDHQLRLIRLFCNHSKHGDKKDKLEKITMSAKFPMTFPIKFDHLQVGSNSVIIAPVIESVIKFWEQKNQSCITPPSKATSVSVTPSASAKAAPLTSAFVGGVMFLNDYVPTLKTGTGLVY